MADARPELALEPQRMPSVTEFAAALAYIEHEWKIEDGGPIAGEQWAEAFAFCWPLSQPEFIERRRAQMAIDQLREDEWLEIVVRAIHMRISEGYAFEMRT